MARLFRLATSPGREGTYESPVKDSKFISRWGVLAWRGETPEGSGIEFYTRSGNTDRPDQTWSDWAGPYRNGNGSEISSPPARYIQWRAVLRGSGASTPATVTSSSFGGPQPGPPAANKVPITFTWQADDPNGDPLTYALYVKAADEQEWHLIKDKLPQNTFTLEPDSLADGRYVARLVASDGESNPSGMARDAELVSAPFWIDNTPPAVRVLEQKLSAGGVEIRFQAEDSTSPLRNAEVSNDGKDWKDVYSDDGIVDSRRETFTVRFEGLQPGEHIVTLRAYDTGGNAGVGKAT